MDFTRDQPQLAAIREILFVSVSVEQMDFISATRSVQHSVLREMIVGSFDLQDFAVEVI